MNLLTCSEIAENWGVSRRRVSTLCRDGRIDGAILKGKTWLIPEDAEKPLDPRRIIDYTWRPLSPFVKWAGGKTQLLERLRDNMPHTFGTYYEPFIGGGALFLDVQPNKAVINDVNEQLLNVYRWLRNDAEALIEKIRVLDSLECDKERYYELRDKYNEKISLNELDVDCAALMIWINKHCFNGLYRVNSKGLFNVPYNNKKSGTSMDEDNLRNIGEYLSSNDIQIIQGDFADACNKAVKGDFVYFDSPYVPVSETASFTDYTKDGFSYADHVRLAELFIGLDKKGVNVMLSNNDVPLVHELYHGYKIIEVDARRSINSDASKRTGKEVIIKNY